MPPHVVLHPGPHSLAVISELVAEGQREEERVRESMSGQKLQDQEKEKDQTGVAAVARSSGGEGRTCLHLFQRAQRWVVTSRVGRHGNLLGLPKRGSIVLPVKTARDPDPTGSPTHMDSQSRRTWRTARGARGREGDGFVVPRAEIISSSSLKLFNHQMSSRPTDGPHENTSPHDTAAETRAEFVTGARMHHASVANC